MGSQSVLRRQSTIGCNYQMFLLLHQSHRLYTRNLAPIGSASQQGSLWECQSIVVWWYTDATSLDTHETDSIHASACSSRVSWGFLPPNPFLRFGFSKGKQVVDNILTNLSIHGHNDKESSIMWQHKLSSESIHHGNGNQCCSLIWWWILCWIYVAVGWDYATPPPHKPWWMVCKF